VHRNGAVEGQGQSVAFAAQVLSWHVNGLSPVHLTSQTEELSTQFPFEQRTGLLSGHGQRRISASHVPSPHDIVPAAHDTSHMLKSRTHPNGLTWHRSMPSAQAQSANVDSHDISGHLTGVSPEQVLLHREVSLTQKALFGHFDWPLGHGHVRELTSQVTPSLQRCGLLGPQGQRSLHVPSQHFVIPEGHVFSHSVCVTAHVLSAQRIGVAIGHEHDVSSATH